MQCRTAVGTSSLACLTLFGCMQGSATQSSEATRGSATAPPAAVVEVTATEYAFQTRDTIPAGWTTFRMTNAGAQHHFFLLQRLPEGKSFAEYASEVGGPFVRVMEARQGGMSKADATGMLVQQLPEWYLGAVRQMGGVGLLAPGAVSETAVRLEPGTYVMECYVKAPDGRFHSALGMARPLVVTPAMSTEDAPTATDTVTLTNTGIHAAQRLTSGTHTIAVRYDEHPQAGLGNDVHVVRLADDAELEHVTSWMDWMEIGGLRAPAPAPFLGGAQEMPVGSTSFFTLTLSPGRYAWITEAPAEQPRVSTFTVE